MLRLTQREGGVPQVRIGQCVELLRHLENVVRVTFVPFESWSRRVKSRQKPMWMNAIREEVVSLRRPTSIDFVQRVQIARRRRVEHIHVAAPRLLGDVGNREKMRCEEGSGWKNLPRH